MIGQVVRRCARYLMLIPIVAIASYYLMAALPITAETESKRQLPTELLASYRRDLGIGEPFGVLRPWIKLFRGERLGTASQGLTGGEMLAKLAGSIGVGLLALSFALIWTALLSSVAGAKGRRGRWRGFGDMFIALAMGSPVFILALLLAPLAAERGHYLPELAGAFAISIWPGALLTSLLSDSVAAELRRDYVKTAQAKGLSPGKTWLKHVLPNVVPTLLDSLVPVTTSLLAGSFAAERVLGLPYFGQLYVLAVLHRQVAVVVVATTFFAAILAVVAIIVESLRAMVDPRVGDRLAQ